jgi:hypothetical protein
MPKPNFGLSAQDKTKNASGYGHTFHHTDPQRHVRFPMYEMLCPASADDIAPISPEAMVSVQKALALMANLVGDRDINLFMGNVDHDGRCTKFAQDIKHVAEGLATILRVAAPDKEIGQ